MLRGVLNRDEFANILTLDDDSSFMAELVPIFTTDMEAFFTRAAAWVEQLPEIPEHERNSGLPSEIRRVYDNFNVRLAACTSAYTMGALRLKDALWELRNRKHAYDAQGCKEALRVAELAYPEFKGVLEDFLEVLTLPTAWQTDDLCPANDSICARSPVCKLRRPISLPRVLNLRETHAIRVEPIS
ncbi:hypothetical protein KFL_001030060 [Klebsormidium nitens]|uniref:Uncharacterized protein n=1 Tax=Klebsormidium nitens TaxID=105231 RepID=A0A1Y1HZ19_KLENI|nr:hypothetical protein KFL_001030060 [Klebsormidium nitens]|eukprot:GAQ82181.1 hypothetical protein KFL_001030060 [Klebsormidium nitens]